MLDGETILSGASSVCDECGEVLAFEVLSSGAGYYIGTTCSCGPYSRESDYYHSREAAQADLDDWSNNPGATPGWAR
jgi:cytidylate kinase